MLFFKTSISKTLIILAISLIAVAAILSSGQAIDGGGTGDSEHAASETSHSGFFGMLMSPIRATLRTARNFFSHRASNVRDAVEGGFSMAQLQTYKLFMRVYNKTYSPTEIPRRMALFFDRRQAIADSMRAFSEGRMSFVMRENAFTDWDEDELKALAGVSMPKSLDDLTPAERETLNLSSASTPSPFALPAVSDSAGNGISDADMVVRAERIPARMDWRQTGCIAEPINQHKCGACYAVATMETLSSMRCINKVSSPILSPQQIVDCATSRAGYQNFGCDGGWPTRVLEYLKDTKLAARETCYPFVRQQRQCRLSQVRAVSGCTVSASPTDTRLTYKVLHNERDILYHVATSGPVITVMRATDKFLYYGSGIFDDSTCSNRYNDVDHAISIVGYGKENGMDYWLIKNSWGTDWGENGFGKYRRGKNACSIGHWGWVIQS